PQTRQITVLNSLLSAGSTRGIDYDITTSTSTAVCLYQDPPGITRDWRHEWATVPGLESLTIRASFMDGTPIVVFPCDGPHSHWPAVIVQHVLEIVHQAARDRLQGSRREGGLGLEENGWDCGPLYNEHYTAPSMATGRGWRWGGLVPSRTERDVWVLL
ncbi:hypothetical protein DFP72DRAFT_767645, partial [Ephemerocybe angulata]